ncbi:MAG: hypothetical protein ACOY0T_05780 [Myxococcota bacterium]
MARPIVGMTLLAIAALSACGNADSKDANAEGGQSGNLGKGGASGGRGAIAGNANAGEAGAFEEGGFGGGLGGRAAGGFGGGAEGAAGGRPPGSGGAFGFGGAFGIGGFSFGGSSSGGAASGGKPGAGGSASCLGGVPCLCGASPGITKCVGEKSQCECPSADQCASPKASSCFKACGGEPFGTWRLMEACFPTGISAEGSCIKVVSGKTSTSDLTLRILDGGELQVRGTERVDLKEQASLGCLGIDSVNQCSRANLFAYPFLFGMPRSLDCAASACGVCDCVANGLESFSLDFSGTWRREGESLWLAASFVPYCVNGEELWIGGGFARDGTQQVAYKLKKESCRGKPLPCAQRTAEQCGKGGSCASGVCQATTGSSTRCAMANSQFDCGVLQGCTWNAAGCRGTANDNCDFSTCDEEPGCSWGAPLEHCGGTEQDCGLQDPMYCEAAGCTLRNCYPNSSDFGICEQLSATECPKALGCTLEGQTCSGQARCLLQPNPEICGKLGCSVTTFCEGAAKPCRELSVSQCHDVPGCRLEW